MAAAGIGNSAGAIWLNDFGTPKVVSGFVKNVVCSGGTLCYASGAAAVVSSGLNSFNTSDVTFVPDPSGAAFNGIALYSAGSNSPIAVATDGVFILVCNDTVTAGNSVKCDGNNAVANIGVGSPEIYLGGISNPVGVALTEGASGGYAVIQIK